MRALAYSRDDSDFGSVGARRDRQVTGGLEETGDVGQVAVRSAEILVRVDAHDGVKAGTGEGQRISLGLDSLHRVSA